MTTHLTLAHGTNARRDRARLVELSNAGTDWTGANGSIRGEAGPTFTTGRLAEVMTDTDYRIASGQLGSAQFVIYSYATPIAWLTHDGAWIVPDARYSRTTGRHQSYLYALRTAQSVSA